MQMCLQSKPAIGIKPKQINMYLSSSCLLLFNERPGFGGGAIVVVGEGQSGRAMVVIRWRIWAPSTRGGVVLNLLVERVGRTRWQVGKEGIDGFLGLLGFGRENREGMKGI